MKIDVDELIRKVNPWELKLTIGGQEYSLRPPVLADLDTLQKFRANEGLTEQEAAKLIADLFEDPKPDLAGATLPVFNFVSQAVMKYIGDYLSKKNQMALLQEAGMAPKPDQPQAQSSTSGNS